MAFLEKLDQVDRWFNARMVRWESAENSGRSRLWLTSVMVAVVMVPAMTIVLFQSFRNEEGDTRVRRALEREGAIAVGTVTEVGSLKAANVFTPSVRVEFTTDTGERVSTRIPVSHRPAEGDRVEVRYLRSDPSVGRVADDEAPHRGRWKLVVIGGLVLSGVVVGLATVSERIRDRRR